MAAIRGMAGVRALSLYLQIWCRKSPPSLPCCYSALAPSKEPENPMFHHTAEFLRGECALSPSDFSILRKSVLKYRGTTSLERSQEAVKIFREYGLSDSQLRKIALGNPGLLLLKPETLRPKLQTLESLGFSMEEVANVASRSPRAIGVKHTSLSRKIQYLAEHVFRGRREDLAKAVKAFPHLLGIDPEKATKVLNMLQSAGMSRDVIHSLISKCPAFLGRSAETLQEMVDYLKDVGFDDDASSKKLAIALECVSRCGGNLEDREQVFIRFGLKKDEVREMFLKFPRIMASSPAKIENVMDFLRNVAGLELNDFVKFPMIVVFSLEKRLKPRFEAFRYLKAQNVDRLPCLARFLYLPEKAFLKAFVCGTPNECKLRTLL